MNSNTYEPPASDLLNTSNPKNGLLVFSKILSIIHMLFLAFAMVLGFLNTMSTSGGDMPVILGGILGLAIFGVIVFRPHYLFFKATRKTGIEIKGKALKYNVGASILVLALCILGMAMIGEPPTVNFFIFAPIFFMPYVANSIALIKLSKQTN